ncbi:MAG: TolC family protein [Rickettsiales bacterium]
MVNKTLYRYSILLLATVSLPCSSAYADKLPWLEDPFGGRDKIAAYGNNLKPLTCPAIPKDKKQFTLNETVIISLCHNPSTRAAYIGLLSSADSFAANYSRYLPTVTATAAATRSGSFSKNSKNTSISNSTGLSAGVTLYDFGQREFTIEAAEYTLAAAGYTYDSTLQGAISTAISGYYNLLNAQNALEVALESQKFARESFEAAELRHSVGLVPLADKLQAKVTYSQSDLSVQQAENSLSISRASLAQIMGLGADSNISVAEIDDSNLLTDPFGGEVKELIELAKAKRVDLAASRASLEGARTSLKALKRSNLATVSASVNSGFDDLKVFNSATTRSQSIGISVSVPIFTGFTQTYNTRIAENNIKAQEENLESAELGVERDVWNAWHNYNTAKRSWETSWDQLASATQLRDVALGRYKEGIGTILDVLSAQSSYRSALQSHLSTRLSLLTSRVDLIRAVGALNLDTIEEETASSSVAPANTILLD